MDLIVRFVVYGIARLISPFTTAIEFRIRERLRIARANGWQPVQGTVHQVTSVYNEHAARWEANLSYSYQWEGEYYSGYSLRAFGRERDIDRFNLVFPAGSPITIRVNPNHREKSALIYGEQFVSI